MEYTQEELELLIDGVTGEVLEREPVYGGFRPLLIEYNLPDGRIVRQRFSYFNPAVSDGWGEHTITLEITPNALP